MSLQDVQWALLHFPSCYHYKLVINLLLCSVVCSSFCLFFQAIFTLLFLALIMLTISKKKALPCLSWGA